MNNNKTTDLEKVEDLETLSAQEKNTLEKCEVKIREGFCKQYDIGIAFKTIRDEKLYRDNFKTFEDYCDSIWGFSRQSGYNYIHGADVIDNVGGIEVVNSLVKNSLHFCPNSYHLDIIYSGCKEESQQLIVMKRAVDNAVKEDRLPLGKDYHYSVSKQKEINEQLKVQAAEDKKRKKLKIIKDKEKDLEEFIKIEKAAIKMAKKADKEKSGIIVELEKENNRDEQNDPPARDQDDPDEKDESDSTSQILVKKLKEGLKKVNDDLDQKNTDVKKVSKKIEDMKKSISHRKEKIEQKNVENKSNEVKENQENRDRIKKYSDNIKSTLGVLFKDYEKIEKILTEKDFEKIQTAINDFEEKIVNCWNKIVEEEK